MRAPIDTKRLKPVRRKSLHRRWCVPAALLRDPDAPETMEGASILDDVPGDRGVLLWQTYRDILLWSSVDVTVRANLFAPDALARQESFIAKAAFPDEAGAAVRRVASVLRGNRPREGDAEEIRRACGKIAEWAASVGACRTALCFAQGAAAACPTDSEPALRVGRLASRYGRRSLAESWLTRGIALARRQGDWSTYGNAFLELGWQADRNGEPRRARARYTRALRTARRYGDAGVRAHALHGLFRVAAAASEFDDAERFVRAALRYFGPDHPLRPTVLHEYAELVLSQATAGLADVREAGLLVVQLVSAILPDRTTESERIASLLLLIRAASFAKDVLVLENAWFDAVTAIETLGETREAGRHLMELARTAAEILEERRAYEIAHRAHAVAIRVRDRALAEEVDSFLARPRLRAAS
jgi:tetratricopeptide (TPR) repeat protein